jgi:hypothetical protein
LRGVEFTPCLFVDSDFPEEIIDIFLQSKTVAHALNGNNDLFIVVVVTVAHANVASWEAKQQLIDITVLVLFLDLAYLGLDFH